MQPNRKLADQTYSDLARSLQTYLQLSKDQTELTVGKHIHGSEVIGNVMIITPAYFKRYAQDNKNIIIADEFQNISFHNLAQLRDAANWRNLVLTSATA